jgi:hypothetical protein
MPGSGAEWRHINEERNKASHTPDERSRERIVAELFQIERGF